MATSSEEALLVELRRSPLSRADALIHAAGIGSQATFSRSVTGAGDRIVAIGRARARRYAAARDIAGLGRVAPIFRIDSSGKMELLAHLRPYAPAGMFVDDPAGLPRWMRGARGNGTFDGPVVFVRDLRPRGFLGASFAARLGEGSGLAADPAGWSDDEAIVAIARAGDDLPGDLVVGDEAAKRVYEAWANAAPPVARADRSRIYPELAGRAIAGIVPGGVVGGEQPKFGALVAAAAGGARHVLVKFSPSEYSTSARRWCDLLVCEHLAHEAMRARGWAAAGTEILEGGSRVFLEVERFDRVGEHGRRAVVTLATMNAEYAGMAPNAGRWAEAASRLAADGWLSPDTVARVRAREAFGRFIANTDTHLDDVSFFPRDDGSLDLAPAYDMLPMGYAPVAGDVPQCDYVVPAPEPGHEMTWTQAGGMAAGYWRTVSRDDRVSRPFQAIAAANADAVERALEMLRPKASA